MDLICFASQSKKAQKLIKLLMENLSNAGNMEVYRTVNSLKERLLRPKKLESIVILYAENKKDMDEIVAIKNLLFDIKIILIMTDSDNEAVVKGHSIKPRILINDYQNITIITEVVNKIRRSFYSSEKQGK